MPVNRVIFFFRRESTFAVEAQGVTASKWQHCKEVGVGGRWGNSLTSPSRGSSCYDSQNIWCFKSIPARKNQLDPRLRARLIHKFQRTCPNRTSITTILFPRKLTTFFSGYMDFFMKEYRRTETKTVQNYM